MDVIEFREGGDGQVTAWVGKKSLFASKDDFIDRCIREFESTVEDLNSDFPICPDLVEEAHCRYFVQMPEGMGIDSGYMFCEPGNGAFEVYVFHIS